MGYQTAIPAALAAHGLTVESVPGWQTRGSATFTPGGVVCHWTAGPRAATGRPSLGVVTNGRAGLPGPLCNVYLDRQGVAVVVAAGRANHAGAGGWRNLAGNSTVFGIEAEAAGDGDWTPAQRATYPHVVAALLDLIGRDASWACGHNEWAPTRKIDIRDWDMTLMRAQVTDIQTSTGPEAAIQSDTNPTSEEDDMLHTIIALYITHLGRLPDAAGAASWITQVAEGRLTWAQVGESLRTSPESAAFTALGSEDARNQRRNEVGQPWVLGAVD